MEMANGDAGSPRQTSPGVFATGDAPPRNGSASDVPTSDRLTSSNRERRASGTGLTQRRLHVERDSSCPDLRWLLWFSSLGGTFLVSAQGQQSTPATPAAPQPERRKPQTAHTGTLRVEVRTTRAGLRINSGVIVTSEGVVVVDALESEAMARAQRDAIANVIKQPVRVLVSSPHHDPYSKGNIAYHDVWKIGHENYRTDLLASMERGKISAEEQKARLPHTDLPRPADAPPRWKRDSGAVPGPGSYTGRQHRVQSPQDRIAYLSEVFFAYQFPTFGGGRGHRVAPGSGGRGKTRRRHLRGGAWSHPRRSQGTPGRKSASSGRSLPTVATLFRRRLRAEQQEDQTAAAVTLPQYDKLPTLKGQREGMVRRMYRELTAAAKRP